jgi:hypothetical protein
METRFIERKPFSEWAIVVIIILLVGLLAAAIIVAVISVSIEQKQTSQSDATVLNQLYESQSQMGQVVENFNAECFGIAEADRELCTWKYVVMQNSILSDELVDIGKLIGK